MVSSGPDVRDEHGFNMCLKYGYLQNNHIMINICSMLCIDIEKNRNSDCLFCESYELLLLTNDLALEAYIATTATTDLF